MRGITVVDRPRLRVVGPFVCCAAALLLGGCGASGTYGPLATAEERPGPWEGCTVGCATGNATTDGRPICWKNRDANPKKNRLHYFPAEAGQLAVVGVVGASTDRIKMGLNEAGLSAGNARTENMVEDASGVANSSLTEWALRHCETVECVREAIVDKTHDGIDHWPGVQAGAFPFMDRSGRVLLLEVGEDHFFEYDPDNATRAEQFPRRFFVRANAAHRNPDQTDTDGVGGVRYTAARDNFRAAAADGISIAEMIDLVARHGDPNAEELQNSNRNTTGTQINHGVLAGEDPATANMWVAVSQPDYCAFVPVWVAAGDRLPPELTQLEGERSLTSLGWELYGMRDDDSYDAYVNTFLQPLEANFREAAAAARARWREVGFRVDEAAAITREAAATTWQTMSTMSRAQDRRALNHTPALTAIDAEVRGLDVAFSRRAEDPDGTITLTEWDFGDGTLVEGAAPAHTYAEAGTYLVRCRVQDNDGSRNSRWTYVTVSAAARQARPPEARAEATPTSGVAPLEIVLDATGSTDAEGEVVAYEWRQREVISTKARFTTTLRDPGTYAFVLTVWDDDGESDRVTVWVDVAPASAAVEEPRGGCGIWHARRDGAGLLLICLVLLVCWRPRRQRLPATGRPSPGPAAGRARSRRRQHPGAVARRRYSARAAVTDAQRVNRSSSASK